MEKKSMAY
jgi:hypothetical protein